MRLTNPFSLIKGDIKICYFNHEPSISSTEVTAISLNKALEEIFEARNLRRVNKKWVVYMTQAALRFSVKPSIGIQNIGGANNGVTVFNFRGVSTEKKQLKRGCHEIVWWSFDGLFYLKVVYQYDTQPAEVIARWRDMSHADFEIRISISPNAKWKTRDQLRELVKAAINFVMEEITEPCPTTPRRLTP